MEQSHRRPEFHIVGRSEDFVGRAAFNHENQPRALLQSRSENGVLQIGFGLVTSGNCVFDRNRASPQTSDLGKDEPHPVTLLGACFKLRHNLIEDSVLGQYTAFQMVGIAGRALRVRGRHGSSGEV